MITDGFNSFADHAEALFSQLRVTAPDFLRVNAAVRHDIFNTATVPVRRFFGATNPASNLSRNGDYK